MHKFCKSDFFDFEFLRLLGVAPCEGSDIAECLEGISKVSENAESWHSVWNSVGADALALAEKAVVDEDAETARKAYLRASNYIRSSEYFLDPFDKRRLPLITLSIDAFNKAAQLFTPPATTVEIPYNEDKLPGYLFRPRAELVGSKKVPLVITLCGWDGTQEELYYYFGRGAVSRGYAVLSFEGPGQGIVLRRDEKYLVAAYEQVTSAVLDWIFDSQHSSMFDSIDVDKIAIWGASMGGYYSLRAAIDKRVGACISCDGFYDLGELLRSRVPPSLLDLWIGGNISDGLLDALVNFISRFHYQTRWEFRNSFWNFGVDTPSAVFRRMMEFSVKTENDEGILAKIDCPVLVTGTISKLYCPAEDNAVKIFQTLSERSPGKHKLWLPQSASDGGLQAKVGAIDRMNYECFRWLDRVFERDNVKTK